VIVLFGLSIQGRRESPWIRSGHQIAVAVKKEFVEVPAYLTRRADCSVRYLNNGCLSSPLTLIWPSSETSPVVYPAEIENLLIGPRLLAFEVVGRKAKDDKAFIFFVAVELLQAGVLFVKPHLLAC